MNIADWTTIGAALGNGSPWVLTGIPLILYRSTIDYAARAVVDDWRESRRVKRTASMSDKTYERCYGS